MKKINKLWLDNSVVSNENEKSSKIQNLQNNVKTQYWLALWWWSALWLSHIWVIKYLEENYIIIKEVSGTSMWAIIASFYAAGKSSEYMIDFAKSINFLKFIDFDLKNWLI